MEQKPRRLVPPLGWPFKRPEFVTVDCANRMPRPLALNRYPGQAIGLVLRLPAYTPLGGVMRNMALSIVWAKPARWWSK